MFLSACRNGSRLRGLFFTTSTHRGTGVQLCVTENGLFDPEPVMNASLQRHRAECVMHIAGSHDVSVYSGSNHLTSAPLHLADISIAPPGHGTGRACVKLARLVSSQM